MFATIETPIPVVGLIIALICARSQDGIGQLSKKYGAYAYAVARRFVGSLQDAEECVNDALLDVWNAKNIEEIKNLKAFVAACVRRRAVDLLRRENAEKRSGNMGVLLSELSEVCDTDTTESRFEARELRARLDSFVKAQKQPDRDIFLLRYFYGMEIREIAKRQHMSRSAVDNRLSRCRKKLKAYLEEQI